MSAQDTWAKWSFMLRLDFLGHYNLSLQYAAREWSALPTDIQNAIRSYA
jgi:hypothetical protein